MLKGKKTYPDIFTGGFEEYNCLYKKFFGNTHYSQKKNFLEVLPDFEVAYILYVRD